MTPKQLHHSPVTVSSIGQCLALYVSSQEAVPKRKLDVPRKICDGFLVGLYHPDVCSWVGFNDNSHSWGGSFAAKLNKGCAKS